MLKQRALRGLQRLLACGWLATTNAFRNINTKTDALQGQAPVPPAKPSILGVNDEDSSIYLPEQHLPECLLILRVSSNPSSVIAWV